MEQVVFDISHSPPSQVKPPPSSSARNWSPPPRQAPKGLLPGLAAVLARGEQGCWVPPRAQVLPPQGQAQVALGAPGERRGQSGGSPPGVEVQWESPSGAG